MHSVSYFSPHSSFWNKENKIDLLPEVLFLEGLCEKGKNLGFSTQSLDKRAIEAFGSFPLEEACDALERAADSGLVDSLLLFLPVRADVPSNVWCRILQKPLICSRDFIERFIGFYSKFQPKEVLSLFLFFLEKRELDIAIYFMEVGTIPEELIGELLCLSVETKNNWIASQIIRMKAEVPYEKLEEAMDLAILNRDFRMLGLLTQYPYVYSVGYWDKIIRTAARTGDASCMSLLLQFFSDQKEKNKNLITHPVLVLGRESSLRIAAYLGHGNVVTVLLDRFPDLRFTPPLNTAAVFDHVETARAILARTKPVDKRADVFLDANCSIALFKAAQSGSVKVVSFLLQARPNISLCQIRSSFIAAARQGHIEVMKAILDQRNNLGRETLSKALSATQTLSPDERPMEERLKEEMEFSSNYFDLNDEGRALFSRQFRILLSSRVEAQYQMQVAKKATVLRQMEQLIQKAMSSP